MKTMAADVENFRLK